MGPSVVLSGISQPKALNALDIEVDLETHRLRASVPDEADNPQSGSVAFRFDEQVGLPALLKLLNLEAFRKFDYFDPEVAYLRERKYIMDPTDPSTGPAIAPDLRSKLGSELFLALLSTESMRNVFSNAYRLPDSLHVRLLFKAEAPAVLGLPWELLYHDEDFLFGGARATLSRHLAYSQLQYPRPPLDVQQLRVLLIAPRPGASRPWAWPTGMRSRTCASSRWSNCPRRPSTP